MSASSNVVFPLDQCPALVLEQLFDRMTPSELVNLSMVSAQKMHMIEAMRLKGKIEVTVNRSNVVINITNVLNLESDIVVGKCRGAGKQFSCHFDREHFRNCQHAANGVVFPYGLGTVFHRILRLFPRVTIENINIALSSSMDSAYDSVFQLLEILRSTRRSVGKIQFVMKNKRYRVDTIRPLLDISEVAGSALQLPETLIVENGDHFPISNSFHLGMRTVLVKKSQFTDEDFNDFLFRWDKSSDRRLHTFVVVTSEKSLDALGDVLLMGVSRNGRPLKVIETSTKQSHMMHRIKRQYPRAMATVIRKDDEFIFNVD